MVCGGTYTIRWALRPYACVLHIKTHESAYFVLEMMQRHVLQPTALFGPLVWSAKPKCGNNCTMLKNTCGRRYFKYSTKRHTRVLITYDQWPRAHDQYVMFTLPSRVYSTGQCQTLSTRGLSCCLVADPVNVQRTRDDKTNKPSHHDAVTQQSHTFWYARGCNVADPSERPRGHHKIGALDVGRFPYFISIDRNALQFAQTT